MEQKLALEKMTSIEGTLLMMDDTTPHVAVPVQAIQDGKVISTTLSDERGKYLFIGLKPGRYQLRCHVLSGYVYYRVTEHAPKNDKKENENQPYYDTLLSEPKEEEK